MAMKIVCAPPDDERQNSHGTGMAQSSYGKKFVILVDVIDIAQQKVGTGQNIAVGQHNALRGSCRARSIPEVRKVIESNIHLWLLIRTALKKCFVVLPRSFSEMDEPANLGRDLLNRFNEFRAVNQCERS